MARQHLVPSGLNRDTQNLMLSGGVIEPQWTLALRNHSAH